MNIFYVCVYVGACFVFGICSVGLVRWEFLLRSGRRVLANNGTNIGKTGPNGVVIFCGISLLLGQSTSEI